MIQVDIRSRVPIYEQLHENIRVLILKGIMKEGEKLPSVRELAANLAINPNTIQKAFRSLESDGYIYSVRGKGNFVSKLDVKQRELEVGLILSKLCETTKEARLLSVELEEVIEVVQTCYKEGNL